MRHLPLLSSVRVDTPCNENWDAMPGDDRVRHCATCNHDVHDLSAMLPAEAEALLANTTGRLCVRIDTPVPPPALLSRARNLAAAVGTGLALAACSPTEDTPVSVPNTPDTSIVTLPLGIDSGSPTSGEAGSHESPDSTRTDSGSHSTRNVTASAASAAPKKTVPPKKFDPRGGKTMGVALRHDREF